MEEQLGVVEKRRRRSSGGFNGGFNGGSDVKAITPLRHYALCALCATVRRS